MPTVGRATEVNMNLLISISEGENLGILMHERMKYKYLRDRTYVLMHERMKYVEIEISEGENSGILMHKI